MSTFKEFLNEAKHDVLDKVGTSRRFNDSSQANSYMSSINQVINSPALEDWARATDDNYDTDSAKKLKQAQIWFKKFVEEIQNAE